VSQKLIKSEIMEKLNYENDLRIEDTALDLEYLEQSSLFMKYARHLAETQRDLDEAKQNLDIVKAETDKKIRETPDKYGLEKVTDKAIEAIILTDKDCKKAYQDFLDAKYEKDMAQNAVNSMNMRKDMLEALIKLNGQQYFAGPKVPRDLSSEAQKREKQRQTNKGVGQAMSRGK
jgi:hypothetical protein